MKNIKILGTGCPKCEKLSHLVEAAAEELGIEINIEKIKNINKIMEYGIMVTPGLVVDDYVTCAGKIPSKTEIKKFLS